MKYRITDLQPDVEDTSDVLVESARSGDTTKLSWSGFDYASAATAAKSREGLD
jgi:hypothetical protein